MIFALLITLFGGLLCFALVAVAAGKDTVGCQVLAAITQFFFLSSITWSNAIAISIVRSVSTMRLTTSKSNKSMILYSIYAIGFPIVCVFITYALSTLEIPSFSNSVYSYKPVCFLYERTTIFALFLVPIYLLIGVNVILGITAITIVAKSGSIGITRDKNKIKKNIITGFKISCCLGLGWVLLFAATFYQPIFYVFQVFVEVQGLFVVLANAIGWTCISNVKQWVCSKSTAASAVSKQNESVLFPTRFTEISQSVL